MRAAVTSTLSGLLWGLLGSFLTRNVFGVHSWLAAPCGIFIGLLVFWGSRWTYRKSAWTLVPTGIISTFVAVALFGLCLGFADLTRDIPNRTGWAVVVQSMNACLWGLIFAPLYWPLFILSFANHALLRHLVQADATADGGG